MNSSASPIIALGLLLCAGCAADEPVTAPPPQPAEEAAINGTGLLWRVDLPDRAPSHVFATLHVSDPRVIALPPAVEEAFNSSTAVGLESVKPDGRDEDLDAMLRLPPGGDLEQIIGPDLFNAVYRLGASEEGFKEDLRRLTPWAAALMVEKLNRSPDGAPVLDDRLRDAARAAGMTVFGLETVKENRAAYKDLPESQQIDLLRSTLRATAMPRNVRRAARDSDIRAYLAGDTGFLMRRWNAAFSGGGRARRQLGDQLLDQRSARFADRMVPWLKKGGMFIAIGAAHLPGEGGVIALLRDRGFSVVRVY